MIIGTTKSDAKEVEDRDLMSATQTDYRPTIVGNARKLALALPSEPGRIDVAALIDENAASNSGVTRVESLSDASNGFKKGEGSLAKEKFEMIGKPSECTLGTMKQERAPLVEAAKNSVAVTVDEPTTLSVNLNSDADTDGGINGEEVGNVSEIVADTVTSSAVAPDEPVAFVDAGGQMITPVHDENSSDTSVETGEDEARPAVEMADISDASADGTTDGESANAEDVAKMVDYHLQFAAADAAPITQASPGDMGSADKEIFNAVARGKKVDVLVMTTREEGERDDVCSSAEPMADRRGTHRVQVNFTRGKSKGKFCAGC